MEHFIIEIMNQWGYLGILFLIAFENIFPPIPSEVILTFGGFLTVSTKMTIPLVILFSTIGSIIGALVLYYIGYVLNPERLEKIVNGRIGKILFLKNSDIKKAEDWFQKRGPFTVFFCRFIPIVRSLISIPAGMTKMKLPLFLILTTIGSVIWNTVLVILGSVTGNNWTKIAEYISTYSKYTLIVLVIVFIVGAFIFYKTKFKKKESR
ncbi:MAG: DedA family protein [Bacilli bacterium]|nr:DedA family protein [Bacilli bacterium]